MIDETSGRVTGAALGTELTLLREEMTCVLTQPILMEAQKAKASPRRIHVNLGCLHKHSCCKSHKELSNTEEETASLMWQ